MKPEIGFDLLFQALAESRQLHAPGGATYRVLQATGTAMVGNCGLMEATPRPFAFGPFGELILPYHSMGACDTRNLLEIDELIIFAFYWRNRTRYRRCLDVGANVGLHSMIMARCGFDVTAFEPDPRHFAWLGENLQLNRCPTVHPIQAAVSHKDGQMDFVRVLGNTTGSHLAGAKSPYGELERFPVRVENIAQHSADVDLMKIDAEGHEPEILLGIPAEALQRCDVMVEVGSARNAARIFDHFKTLGINLFSQKIGWSMVQSITDLPTSHHEGSLFISRHDSMPWGT